MRSTPPVTKPARRQDVTDRNDYCRRSQRCYCLPAGQSRCCWLRRVYINHSLHEHSAIGKWRSSVALFISSCFRLEFFPHDHRGAIRHCRTTMPPGCLMTRSIRGRRLSAVQYYKANVLEACMEVYHGAATTPYPPSRGAPTAIASSNVSASRERSLS